MADERPVEIPDLRGLVERLLDLAVDGSYDEIFAICEHLPEECVGLIGHLHAMHASAVLASATYCIEAGGPAAAHWRLVKVHVEELLETMLADLMKGEVAA